MDVKKIDVGTVLVSEPFMLDSYFKRSVVLVGEYSDEGAIGFILNKPTDLRVTDALEDFPEINSLLYFGGPLQTDTIHFLHTLNYLEGSKQIAPGIYWGGDLEMLKLMIDIKQVTPENIRFYAGYTGWGSYQLVDELVKNKWIVSNKNPIRYVMSDETHEMWGTVLRDLGKSYSVLANFPDEPSLN